MKPAILLFLLLAAWDLALGDNNNNNHNATSSVSDPGITDASNHDFSALGLGSGSSPLFGQALQTNGGFELSLSHWQTMAGRPQVLSGTDGQGDPHGGSRFFHGGLATSAATAVVRQDIDLLAAGFAPEDLDAGTVLDAEAWLRNYYGAGTFDDQVFYRVAYLNDADHELAAVRCLIAADSVWLKRSLTGRLPPGTRRLRVEVIGKHRRDADNDSMTDDLIIRLQKPSFLPNPTITKLPMLQDVRTNAMTLIWETAGNLASPAVEWGRSNVTEHVVSQIETLQVDRSHFVHRATIPGLETETEYRYRVRNGTNTTDTYVFTTAPRRDSPFVTAWWGDNHDGRVTLAKHVTRLLAYAPNLICVAGDMVNNGNSYTQSVKHRFAATRSARQNLAPPSRK